MFRDSVDADQDLNSRFGNVMTGNGMGRSCSTGGKSEGGC
jgi:hypothetical protein